MARNLDERHAQNAMKPRGLNSNNDRLMNWREIARGPAFTGKVKFHNTISTH